LGTNPLAYSKKTDKKKFENKPKKEAGKLKPKAAVPEKKGENKINFKPGQHLEPLKKQLLHPKNKC